MMHVRTAVTGSIMMLAYGYEGEFPLLECWSGDVGSDIGC